MIPRIQGRVGQATDPPEMKDKWFFEVVLSTLGEGNKADVLGPIGPFDTEEEVLAELRNACRIACEEYEKSAVGRTSGQYIDMKTNRRREWTEKDLGKKVKP